MLTTVPRTRQQTAVLLSFVLVSFAANSLVTRYVVGNRLLDAYLLTVVRFVAGAVALLVLTLGRGDRPSLTRANLWPAFWLGVYAVCISFGYEHIGPAPNVGDDGRHGPDHHPDPHRRRRDGPSR